MEITFTLHRIIFDVNNYHDSLWKILTKRPIRYPFPIPVIKMYIGTAPYCSQCQCVSRVSINSYLRLQLLRRLSGLLCCWLPFAIDVKVIRHFREHKSVFTGDCNQYNLNSKAQFGEYRWSQKILMNFTSSIVHCFVTLETIQMMKVCSYFPSIFYPIKSNNKCR